MESRVCPELQSPLRAAALECGVSCLNLRNLRDAAPSLPTSEATRQRRSYVRRGYAGARSRRLAPFDDSEPPHSDAGVCYSGGVKAGKSNLSREFKRLFRSMSFASPHPSLNRGGPQAERFVEI